MHEFEAALVIIAVVLVGVFIGGQWYGKHKMEQQAVENGYALYCPDTGDFAWSGECGVQEESK